MFDLGWSELFIIGLITLLVVGPKELPRVLRTISQVLAKLRGLAREFQTSVDEMVRETEIEDLKNEINALRDQADIRKQVGSIMDEAERDLNNPSKPEAGQGADTTPATVKVQQAAPELPEKADEPVVNSAKADTP